MEPEEIDKLFKDRFAGLPTMPSADAWSRLQQKMEPPKKEKTVWMYYAAASISILMVLGVLFYRNQGLTNHSAVAFQKPAENEEIKNNKKISSAQATENIASASTNKKADTFTGNGIEMENKGATKIITNTPEPVLLAAQTRISKKVKSSQPELAKEQEVKVIEEAPQVALEMPKAANPDLTLAMNKPQPEITAGIVQVMVKRDNLDDANEDSEEPNLRENLAKKGALLKKIYKQARNLKNGEPVEFASLGVNTEKFQSESKLIKEKINKVISL